MIADLIKKIGLMKVVLTAFIGLLVMGALIFLSIRLTANPMSIIYSNLSSEDSHMVVSRLDAMGVPYQVVDSGKEILVPINKVLNLRMAFAQEGIPRSGSIIGYEIFNKGDSLGTSQFVYNVNLVRALEGELARTISSLSSIETAKVHLVMPKKELFAKSQVEPTASVLVKVAGSQSLSNQEVEAISYLVANAVPSLAVDKITILDQRGKPLKLGSGADESINLSNDLTTSYQHAVEERLQSILEELLERSLGVGKIKANVSAEINVDREIINSEVFDADNPVVRSKKTTEENETEKESSSNELSVSSNVQGGQGAKGGAGKNKARTDELTNYEVSKTITNKITETGRIKKLSIAILVDGIYQADAASTDPQNPTMKYVPRTAQELEQIKSLASTAVGFDTKRGDNIEVINMQFSEEFSTGNTKEKPMSWLKDELENIVQTVVIGIVIILVVLLVIRPVIMRTLEMRKIAAETADVQEEFAIQQAAIQTQQSAAIAKVEEDEDFDFGVSNDEKRKIVMLKRINELAEKHPEETVAIIRNWLYSSNM